jgi:hypothetical protein
VIIEGFKELNHGLVARLRLILKIKNVQTGI